MKNLILTLIITLPLTLWGQGWTNHFGNNNTENEGYSVRQTNDGGYIITGYTYFNTLGGKDVYVIKTDEFGNEEWSKKYGGTYDDNGRSIEQTSDGGYIIVGDIYDISSNSDVFLIKTDEYGDTLWTKTFGSNYGDFGRSVKQTNDNGYILTGYKDYNTSSPQNQDLILIKTNSLGDTLWSKFFTTNCEWGHYVQETDDGGYIVIGDTRLNSSSSIPLDILFVKLDSVGNISWKKKFGDNLSSERGLSGQQTNDGGYIIGGYTSLNGDDMMMIKTNEQGDSLWSKTFGGSLSEVCSSIQQTNDNGYILTGYTFSFGGGQNDIYLVKTDSIGNLLWSNTYGNTGSDRGYSVQQTIDGGYIITGFTSYIPGVTSSNNKDIWLIKTNGNGVITSTFEIPLPNPERKLEKTINLKGQEIKSQTNTPVIEIFDDGSVEKKLIIEK